MGRSSCQARQHSVAKGNPLFPAQERTLKRWQAKTRVSKISSNKTWPGKGFYQGAGTKKLTTDHSGENVYTKEVVIRYRQQAVSSSIIVLDVFSAGQVSLFHCRRKNYCVIGKKQQHTIHFSVTPSIVPNASSEMYNECKHVLRTTIHVRTT